MARTQGNEGTSGYQDPDLQTPGYSPGGNLNPAMGIERPEGGSSRDLSPNREGHTVGSPAGPFQVMSAPISRFSFLRVVADPAYEALKDTHTEHPAALGANRG